MHLPPTRYRDYVDVVVLFDRTHVCIPRLFAGSLKRWLRKMGVRSRIYPSKRGRHHDHLLVEYLLKAKEMHRARLAILVTSDRTLAYRATERGIVTILGSAQKPCSEKYMEFLLELRRTLQRHGLVK